MEIRILKIVLVVIVALLGLVYAGQNVANLEAAYQAIAYVVGMTDHTIYPASLGPAFNSPVLVWAVLAVIVLAEFTVGFLAAKGARDLWAARRAPGAGFNAAKTYALLACGMGVVVWFGFFIVLAGGYFQMWQTEVGRMSLDGALQFGVVSGIIFLIVNMSDD